MEVGLASRHEEATSKNPPTLSAFMKLLTQLGGYNNRATEAPPGPQLYGLESDA